MECLTYHPLSRWALFDTVSVCVIRVLFLSFVLSQGFVLSFVLSQGSLLFSNQEQSFIPPLRTAEATGLDFVWFVVLNPRVLSANRADFGLFYFFKQIPISPPPPRWLERRRGMFYPQVQAYRYCRSLWGGLLICLLYFVSWEGGGWCDLFTHTQLCKLLSKFYSQLGSWRVGSDPGMVPQMGRLPTLQLSISQGGGVLRSSKCGAILTVLQK